MSRAIENLADAQKRAMAGRPKVRGFPYLAETLRQAGVTRNLCFLPACESIFLTNDGPVVLQGTPLTSGMADVPPFDREALVTALRTDQAGEIRSRNSWQPRGAPVSCGTTSISRRGPSATTASMVRNTSKPIPLSRLIDVQRGNFQPTNHKGH